MVSKNFLYGLLIHFVSISALGQNWSKKDYDSFDKSFLDQCLNGNPSNKGKEALIRPLCYCILDKIKKKYPDLSDRNSRLGTDDLIAFGKLCTSEISVNNPSLLNEAQGYSKWDIIRSDYLTRCMTGQVGAEKSQARLDKCKCMFDYLKARSKVSSDFEKLNIRTVTDADAHCSL